MEAASDPDTYLYCYDVLEVGGDFLFSLEDYWRSKHITKDRIKRTAMESGLKQTSSDNSLIYDAT